MDIDLQKREETFQQGEAERVRRKGIYKFLFSLAATLATFSYLVASGSRVGELHSAILVGLVAILGYGVAGFAEALSGMPASAFVALLESKWASLRRWQRGILGILIAIFVFLISVVVLLWVPIW